MQIQLLGTAAAEGWPAAWCDCEVCDLARKRRGKDLRMRSGALIDDDLKIDTSPDTIVHMQRAARSLAKVRNIFYTHEHPDHLFAIELKRTVNLARDVDPAALPLIGIHGNHRVVGMIRGAFANPREVRLDVKEPLVPGSEVVLADGTKVLAVAATHCEDALLYRIERGGRSLFYGHDSGFYKTETLDLLGKAGPLDVALLDCTHTTRLDIACKHHMNIPAMMQMIGELKNRGAVTARTRLIATHFSVHSGARTHAELEELLTPLGVEVAFDGMKIVV